MSNELNRYRDEVMIHLKYIKEKVEANHQHLEKVNRRLSESEHNITAMKTVGTTVSVLIGIILTYLGVRK